MENIPIRTDEYYSNTEVNFSYTKILRGEIEEGCNSPLWYCLNKFVGGWKNGRVMSVFFMSVTGILIFYYVSWMGLLLFLVMSLVWNPYYEARMYEMIVLLVTLQCLLMNSKWLGIINVLMALSSSICIVPILASGVVRGWKVVALPLMIVGYYNFVGNHYSFFINPSAYPKILLLGLICFLFFHRGLFFVLNIVMTLLVLWLLSFNHNGEFQVSMRYFIYLLPISIFCVLIPYENRKFFNEV